MSSRNRADSNCCARSVVTDNSTPNQRIQPATNVFAIVSAVMMGIRNLGQWLKQSMHVNSCVSNWVVAGDPQCQLYVMKVHRWCWKRLVRHWCMAVNFGLLTRQTSPISYIFVDAWPHKTLSEAPVSCSHSDVCHGVQGVKGSLHSMAHTNQRPTAISEASAPTMTGRLRLRQMKKVASARSFLKHLIWSDGYVNTCR